MNKFHWGHGITIFYILFVGIVILVLFKSMTIDHSLVVDDYYAKDLAYQEEYNKQKNSLGKDAIFIKTDETKNEVAVEFSSAKITGEIQFYRPSEKSKDFLIRIEGKRTVVDTKMLLKGKWIIKANWKMEGIEYAHNEDIYIQ